MANIELDGVNKKIKVDSGDLTLDVPGDIVLDADGGDVVVADGGTNILKVTNSSSDVVLQPQVDAKDIIFKQFDGTTVATVEDNGTFNIPANKLAIGGTAVTSTAAELNILDGVTSTASELNILDGVTATASELNLLDGGTSVGSSITVADADGFIVNDGGTMKTIPATDISTYVGGTFVKTGSVDFESGTGADNVFLSDVFSDTYDTYMIILRRILPEDDGDLFRMRFTSTGTTEISSGSYNYSSRYFKDDGGVSSRTATGATRFELTDEVSNVQADGGADFTLFLTLDRTDNSGNSGSYHGIGHYNNASTSSHATYVSGVLNTATSSKKPGGLQFLFASGQIRKIHAIVYGIKE